MKKIILLLVIVLGGYALAQFSPPSSVSYYSGTIIVYGTDSEGEGIAVNTFVYVDGKLTSFP
jgi:hypothetical protein